MKTRRPVLFFSILFALTLGGCGTADEEPDQAKDETPGTPVTTTPVQPGEVLVLERTVGRIEAETAPVVDAEVPGTVARIHADAGEAVEAGDILAELDTTDLKIALRQATAEVGRLKALSSNQARTVERYVKLRKQNNLSEGMLEEAQSQLQALREQLESARSQLANARRDLEKATIKAPVSGRIQTRHVAPGDYVGVNAPLFQLAADSPLRIHLPFPETVAERVKPGQVVRLTAPIAPEITLEERIASLRPVLTRGSRAVEALIFLENPGAWAPGASVTAEVQIARRENAMLVPQISVVRRPAGTVVYVLNTDGTVSERPITTGVNRGGQVEIRAGLNGDEQVVVDGASFLTDGTKVQVREAS